MAIKLESKMNDCAKKFVVCRFREADKPGKPGQTQLQCYIGNSQKGTLYLVDHHMSAIHESKVKEDVLYYCGVNRIIGQRDDYHFLATVSVIEELNLEGGGAFWDQPTQKGNQWQYRTSRKNFELTVVIDRTCQKSPDSAGQFWSFDVMNVILAGNGLVIVSAMLKEKFANEHKWRKTMKKRAAGGNSTEVCGSKIEAA